MPGPAKREGALTDGIIAVTSLAVLEAEGPTALSFRRVGSELGTSHMAVHRHCRNFDGLLDICAEHLAAQLPEIDPSLPWVESTERRFIALYETLSSHWALVVLQRGRPWLGPQMMCRFAEPAVAASLASGLPPEQVSACHRELYVYTVGCALTSTTFRDGAGAAAMARLDPDQYPVLHGHRETLRDQRSDHDMFVHGVRTLIASWDPAQPRSAAEGEQRTTRNGTGKGRENGDPPPGGS